MKGGARWELQQRLYIKWLNEFIRQNLVVVGSKCIMASSMWQIKYNKYFKIIMAARPTEKTFKNCSKLVVYFRCVSWTHVTHVTRKCPRVLKKWIFNFWSISTKKNLLLYGVIEKIQKTCIYKTIKNIINHKKTLLNEEYLFV